MAKISQKMAECDEDIAKIWQKNGEKWTPYGRIIKVWMMVCLSL
jgi:hypothetical protein